MSKDSGDQVKRRDEKWDGGKKMENEGKRMAEGARFGRRGRLNEAGRREGNEKTKIRVRRRKKGR